MKWQCVVAGLLMIGSAQSADGSLHVQHAWIRWLPGDLPAAGYAIVVNDSDKQVRMLGADSPDYGGVMLHQSFKRDGTEHMQLVDGIDIPAHGKITLAPGGYHLMLMHARHPIAPGDHAHLNLRFSGDQTVGVDLEVRPANASGN